MNVVDSSGWLEFFADGPNADFFATAIENMPELVVHPSAYTKSSHVCSSSVAKMKPCRLWQLWPKDAWSI